MTQYDYVTIKTTLKPIIEKTRREMKLYLHDVREMKLYLHGLLKEKKINSSECNGDEEMTTLCTDNEISSAD